MKFKILNTIVVVLLLCTAAYTIFVFIPNTTNEVVNIEVSAVVDTPIQVSVEQDHIEKSFSMVEGGTGIYDFVLLNRDIPTRWDGKDIYLKYTFLGEYGDNTLGILNDLLKDDYKWQRQLDGNGDIVLGGPIFIKDGVYQLHTHNGLSLANKHYLFGDLLHYLYSEGVLEGTQILVGDVVLKSIWVKDTRVLEDPTTPSGAQLVISTCLERDGDRRLVTGWSIVRDIELQD